jgi:hypothetical protein
MKHFKLIFWYSIGSFLWFFFTCWMPATFESMLVVYFGFINITGGIIIGILGKESFYNKPWLLLFVPILYLLALLTVG